MKRRLRPIGACAVRAWPSVDEIVQHAAVAQDKIALVEAIRVWRPLRVEIVDARVDRLEGGDLRVGQLISDGDDEVDIAVLWEFDCSRRSCRLR